MNSCLYECQIMHQRLLPNRYGFVHSLFMFYLDLDELDRLAQQSRWFSVERFNLFSFFARDHLQNGPATTKQSLLDWLAKQGIDLAHGRIMLLTNARTFGYVFNPVSFYFCFDEAGAPRCVVAEVHNTFGEMKLYLLHQPDQRTGAFTARTAKHFYVSPFLDLDVFIDFDLLVPGQSLRLHIDDYDGATANAQRILATALTGTARPFTDQALLRYSLRFPFVTLKVIALIHWHALRLWLKGFHWHAKSAQPHLQKGIVNGKPRA